MSGCQEGKMNKAIGYDISVCVDGMSGCRWCGHSVSGVCQ